MIDDHHGELDTILGSEVDTLTGEDFIDCGVEVLRVDQADEVRDLVETVRLIQGPEPFQFLAGRQIVAVGPLAGDLNGVRGSARRG